MVESVKKVTEKIFSFDVSEYLFEQNVWHLETHVQELHGQIEYIDSDIRNSRRTFFIFKVDILRFGNLNKVTYKWR